MKELHEALGILLKYEIPFNSDSICAEHDEIWIGGPTKEQLSPEDIQRLEVLFVTWDEYTDSWHMFT